ncbi:sugar phosphate isomerase/epimerase family protein [Murimonas intestini]|uniref:Sugar phosphate isomerase/epimerase n=1 Tax=Murimonas intestini TaxID=1337051 RepID=A0AB73T7I9_9FIRM|nr:sugar phosphate isomerase/epimerase [Murimonas intestini]MCR1841204.1 sugar phosphate isomerase/epimerase [Murimonas intestini]MCR1866122.1 sugar phosphate isomerase/epimerase [Murimonas intestini]MCR1882761.1 sugar phosphate isomerase/epimerase [Murimonas intestini]
MPIGVCGWTIRDYIFTEKQTRETLKKIADMGYKGVELGQREFWTPAQQKEALDEYGLQAITIDGDLANPEEIIKKAEIVKCSSVCLKSIPGNMMGSPEGFMAYAEMVNKLAEPYKGTGIHFIYHNHAQELRNFPELDGKTGLDILIENTDPDVVWFQIDVHWLVAGGGDPVQWLKKLKGRTSIIHYKDYGIDFRCRETSLGNVPRQFLEVGQGNINWEPITKACYENGIEWFSVEQDQTARDPFTSLQISLNYMRDKLNIE